MEIAEIYDHFVAKCTEPVFSDELVCNFYAWIVIEEGKLGLLMPKNNCCDMAGAISIAIKIMPEVRVIATFSACAIDVVYRLVDGDWVAFHG